MLTNILIALAVIVVVVVIIVALQSSEFRVVRSATMSAPAPVVFAQVNDFHNWEAQSPWAKLDPTDEANLRGGAGRNRLNLHVVPNMDRMVGGQFDKGLAEMKSVVEAARKQ